MRQTLLSFRAERNAVENGASGASDIDGRDARAAASELGDERIKSLTIIDANLFPWQ
jgi:hypothetical protein